MGLNISAPVRIDKNHKTGGFDCGDKTLDHWLRRYALQKQNAGSSVTYVVLDGNSAEVIAFYSLAVGSVEHHSASGRTKKGLPRHPIPVMILARLAVDLEYHGKGIGKALLRNAVAQTVRASEYAGIRAVLVHAKNEDAGRFYKKYGFERSPVDDLMMMLLLKDAKKGLDHRLDQSKHGNSEQ